MFHLKTAAELFMYVLCGFLLETVKLLCIWQNLKFLSCRCDEKALKDSLCQRIIVTRDENIVKTLDPEAAKGSRDALAKTVYSRLFDWWVYFEVIRTDWYSSSKAAALLFHKCFILVLIWQMTFWY
jgi:hypothetical protein